MLARASVRQRRDNLARSLYPRLGSIAALEAEDLYLFGTVIDRLGDHETARECWEDGLRAEPNHAEMLQELARLYLTMGRFSEAYRTRQSPGDATGMGSPEQPSLGQIKFEQDDPAGAARCLRRALDLKSAATATLSPPGRYNKLLAKALLRTGHSVEAAGSCRRSYGGPDAEASWLLSRSFLQAGNRWARLQPL